MLVPGTVVAILSIRTKTRETTENGREKLVSILLSTLFFHLNLLFRGLSTLLLGQEVCIQLSTVIIDMYIQDMQVRKLIFCNMQISHPLVFFFFLNLANIGIIILQ